MKRFFILLIISVSFFTCKAQTIVPYFSDQEIFIDNSGHYYKDVDGDFNKFVGTWKWENGNSSLTIQLKTEIKYYSSSVNYYKDLLVGEYQYIESGVEKVNTLTSIDNTNINPYEHRISGVQILTKYDKPIVCNDCAEDERRVKVVISHPNDNGITGYLILRHVIESGIEKIKATLISGHKLPSGETGPEKIDVPFGEYVLIKQ